MKSKLITPAEMSPKMHVTILEDRDEDGLAIDPMAKAMMNRHNQWIGQPLEVVSIDLPFILMKTPNDQTVSFDSRRYNFMELKDEYWKAIVGDAAEETPLLHRVAQAHDKIAHIVVNLAPRVAAMEQALANLAKLPVPPPPPTFNGVKLAAIYAAGICLITVFLSYLIRK